MTTRWLIPGCVWGCLFLAACASRQVNVQRQECYDPDTQLANALSALESSRAGGCGDGHDPSAACDGIRREIERLALVCPSHAPTLMTNAVMAYEAGQSAKAQQFLDRIFERPQSYPDAAALRSRIAIEEGNLPYARRFLEQQIRLAPDHSGLREAYAAALYLSGQMDGARSELARAEALGAPPWRIAYHLGLIEEASDHLDAAERYYAEAVEKNPQWAPARSRLNALKSHGQRR